MIAAHLGETIDIHGGGLDLIFPHHENEIAQSRCAHGGKPLANYWVHNGFVDMGAEKMSKSLGNVITVDDLLAEGHRGEVLRLALLSAHYRSPLPWTEDRIAEASQTLDKWETSFGNSFENGADRRDAIANPGQADAEAIAGLSDDLNVSKFFEVVHRLAREANDAVDPIKSASAGRKLGATLRVIGITLGHRFEEMIGDIVDEVLLDQELAERIATRTHAKARRDFAEADRIRAELAAEGILLEDGPNGTTWRRA
jgi:cysteinyl-tRNA synthetase